MSNKGLELWRQCTIDYYEKKGEKFHIPKKGTADYLAIRKLYESNGKTDVVKPKESKKACKNCKKFVCRCQCPYPKAK